MARRFAYLTPDNDGTQTIVSRCLPVPLPLLPHVVGALSELTNVWRWEQFGNMTPEDAAQLATVMLNDFGLVGCDDMNCASVIACLLDAGLLNTVSDDALKRVVDGVPQYSFDGGTTWVDMPLNGDGTPYVPALKPVAGADNNARVCLAATRASLVINELYGGVFGALGAGIHNALNTFSAFLRDLNSSLLGLLYGEGWQVLNAEILRDTDLTTNYVAPSLASGVIDELRCLLLSYATVSSSGIVTFDFGAVRDNVIPATNLVDGAAIWGLLGYIGEAGLNAAGSTAITNVPADCGCGAEWCYVVTDFDGWNIFGGALRSGGGVNAVFQGSIYALSLDTEISLAIGTQILSATAVYRQNSSGNVVSRVKYGIRDSGYVLANNGVVWERVATGIEGSETLELVAYADSGVFNRGLWLDEIVFRGVGTNPFGSDNCL